MKYSVIYKEKVGAQILKRKKRDFSYILLYCYRSTRIEFQRIAFVRDLLQKRDIFGKS